MGKLKKKHYNFNHFSNYSFNYRIYNKNTHDKNIDKEKSAKAAIEHMKKKKI